MHSTRRIERLVFGQVLLQQVVERARLHGRQGLCGDGERVFPVAGRRAVEPVEAGRRTQDQQHLVGADQPAGVLPATRRLPPAETHFQAGGKRHAFLAVDDRVLAAQIVGIVLLRRLAVSAAVAGSCTCTWDCSGLSMRTLKVNPPGCVQVSRSTRTLAGAETNASRV